MRTATDDAKRNPEGKMDNHELAAADHPEGSVLGLALSLSGGGYRAMVFHVGALQRLNDAGLLSRLACISSVSGGSITSATLALCWQDLEFVDGRARRFDLFVERVREMAETTVDVGAVIGGILLPGSTNDRVAKAYDRVLFKGRTLQDLPPTTTGAPRFVFNATNVQSAALWRFSRELMGDYRIGLVRSPTVSICQAVAASSAFPPILSPLTLPITQPVEAMEGSDLNRPPFTKQAVLSDGGVYDNLGLETVKRYKTLLVSDAGQKIEAEESSHHDWANHSVRILSVVDNQVRSLRKRRLIGSYNTGVHNGCYWGIRTVGTDYHLKEDPLGVGRRDPSRLANVPTRLERMERGLQDALMNWGYAICDAALRTRLDDDLQGRLGVKLAPPDDFPHPGGY